MHLLLFLLLFGLLYNGYIIFQIWANPKSNDYGKSAQDYVLLSLGLFAWFYEIYQLDKGLKYISFGGKKGNRKGKVKKTIENFWFLVALLLVFRLVIDINKKWKDLLIDLVFLA